MFNNDEERLLDAEVLRHIFYNLNGSFEPVADHAIDEERNANLTTALKFIDGLLFDVMRVAPYKMYSEYSRQYIGKRAHKQLLEWKEMLDEYARIHAERKE